MKIVIPDGTLHITEQMIPKSVTEVIMPDSVTSIDRFAFRCCTELKSITIPNSVTSIGEDAFGGCISLTSITIPSSVTSIGEDAFEHCTGLTSLTIPNSVTSIGNGAFWGCSGLKSITIPKSITSIGHCAFAKCTSLKSKLTNIKATSGNMWCRDMQYKLNTKYTKKNVQLCTSGFHYCENAFELFDYYYGEIGKDVRFFEVDVDKVSSEHLEDSKRVCGKIKLVREITSYAELLAQD